MIHARADYNRIQDPACLIPKDEPVFLLRGQDVHAAATVRYWAKCVSDHEGDLKIAAIAAAHADAMEKWPKKKSPDLPDPETALKQMLKINNVIGGDTLAMAKLLIQRLMGMGRLCSLSTQIGSDTVTVTAEGAYVQTLNYIVTGLEVACEA